MPDDFYNQSLLTHDESNAIKGLLILLIVLGHDIPFVDMTDSWMVMVWLYLFHLQSFFLLPFLYPLKPLEGKRLANLLIRFYIPFVVFLIPLLVIQLLRKQPTPPLYQLPIVFVGGGALFLRKFIGTQFLWFLPAMCICSTLKELHALVSPTARKALLALGASAILCTIIASPKWLMNNTLDYVRLAFRILFTGILLRIVIRGRTSWTIPAAITFLVGSICFFLHYRLCIRPFTIGYKLTPLHHVLTLLVSVSFVILLHHFRSFLAQSSLLKLLGANSLYIYLFHIYWGYLGNRLLTKLHAPLLLSSVVCLVIMLSGGFSIALAIRRCKTLQSIFFPNTVDDFTLAWKKLFQQLHLNSTASN